jgi:hypothetical protein
MTLNSNLSGSYNFDPSLGEIVIGAYARLGIRRTELVQQHMADARFEANLVQSEMQGEGINIWQVDLVTQDLVAGQGVYAVDPTVIFILDLYIRQDAGAGNPVDRLLLPISRSDWAATANKEMQGFPTSYWFDRVLSPQLYLWPVPSADAPESLKYYVQRRAMDADLKNGTQVQIPYQAYDYFTWALAERLAFIYAPDKLQMVTPRKQQAYMKFAQATTENTPVTMDIDVRPYFRL